MELLLNIYEKYPHPTIVLNTSENSFINDIDEMAKKLGHRVGKRIGSELYTLSQNILISSPYNYSIQLAIDSCISLLRENLKVTNRIITKMNELAKSLEEYEIVKSMNGVGKKILPRLIAEIGDIRRFKNANALIAYCGIDPPQYQSGNFEASNRHITKRGNKYLRSVTYEVVKSVKATKPTKDNAVYEFIIKKEKEGKQKTVAKVAGMNKFLRIYYARVKELYV